MPLDLPSKPVGASVGWVAAGMRKRHTTTAAIRTLMSFSLLGRSWSRAEIVDNIFCGFGKAQKTIKEEHGEESGSVEILGGGMPPAKKQIPHPAKTAVRGM